MEPFDSYPSVGTISPQCLGGGNSRTGYGLALQQITGQTTCAYYGISLVDTYDHWLMMSIDHVVPQSARKAIRPDWIDNLYNVVLCCSACNGFANRYRMSADLPVPATFEEFLQLRDRVFLQRKNLVLQRHEQEREEYARRRWEVRRP